MTLKEFAYKLFGYKIYGNGKVYKIHKPIFGLVLMNLFIIPLDWLKAKRLGLQINLLPKKSAVEYAINNPMNEHMKIGYIEPPEYDLKKE